MPKVKLLSAVLLPVAGTGGVRKAEAGEVVEVTAPTAERLVRTGAGIKAK